MSQFLVCAAILFVFVSLFTATWLPLADKHCPSLAFNLRSSDFISRHL
jgi:hypothetical protein